MPDQANAQLKLDELLARWVEAQESGSPIGPAQLCKDSPELRAELDSRIAWLKQMESLTSAVQRKQDAISGKETEHSGADNSKQIAIAADMAPTLDSGPRAPPVSTGWPTIAGYEILGLLGEGGMGAVYKARETRFDRLVALKVIRDGLATADQRARFDAEAKAVAKLQHPNIVQLFSGGQFQPEPGGSLLPYLAFEFIEGGDLEHYAGTAPMPPREAAKLVQTIAQAMDHAHRRGIVHRDLKPANILMSGEWLVASGEKKLSTGHSPLTTTPKVADFGLARQRSPSDAKLTQTGAVMGTAAYMSPEQAEGEEVTSATDIHALGGILYRLLTGKVPFTGKSVVDVLYRVCHQPPEKLCTHVPHIPSVIESICLRCLEKNPADRYPTAAALADDLERFCTGPATTMALPEPAVHRRKARLAVTAWIKGRLTSADRGVRFGCSIGMAAMLAVVAVGVWMASNRGSLSKKAIELAAKEDPRSMMKAAMTSPLRLNPIVVDYYRLRDDKKGTEPPVRMGDGALSARFDDAVVVSITLGEPLYCYVLGFTADGREHLIWPCDRESSPSPNEAPPRVDKLPQLPVGGQQFRLDEEPAGGLQVYVFLASRQPLPAYAEWCKQRGEVKWKRQSDIEGVWQADDKGTYPVLRSQSQARDIKPALGMPPLTKLCAELKSGGIEAVEAIAFPVLAKGR